MKKIYILALFIVWTFGPNILCERQFRTDCMPSQEVAEASAVDNSADIRSVSFSSLSPWRKDLLLLVYSEYEDASVDVLYPRVQWYLARPEKLEALIGTLGDIMTDERYKEQRSTALRAFYCILFAERTDTVYTYRAIIELREYLIDHAWNDIVTSDNPRDSARYAAVEAMKEYITFITRRDGTACFPQLEAAFTMLGSMARACPAEAGSMMRLRISQILYESTRSAPVRTNVRLFTVCVRNLARSKPVQSGAAVKTGVQAAEQRSIFRPIALRAAIVNWMRSFKRGESINEELACLVQPLADSLDVSSLNNILEAAVSEEAEAGSSSSFYTALKAAALEGLVRVAADVSRPVIKGRDSRDNPQLKARNLLKFLAINNDESQTMALDVLSAVMAVRRRVAAERNPAVIRECSVLFYDILAQMHDIASMNGGTKQQGSLFSELTVKSTAFLTRCLSSSELGPEEKRLCAVGLINLVNDPDSEVVRFDGSAASLRVIIGDYIQGARGHTATPEYDLVREFNGSPYGIALCAAVLPDECIPHAMRFIEQIASTQNMSWHEVVIFSMAQSLPRKYLSAMMERAVRQYSEYARNADANNLNPLLELSRTRDMLGNAVVSTVIRMLYKQPEYADLSVDGTIRFSRPPISPEIQQGLVAMARSKGTVRDLLERLEEWDKWGYYVDELAVLRDLCGLREQTDRALKNIVRDIVLKSDPEEAEDALARTFQAFLECGSIGGLFECMRLSIVEENMFLTGGQGVYAELLGKYLKDASDQDIVFSMTAELWFDPSEDFAWVTAVDVSEADIYRPFFDNNTPHGDYVIPYLLGSAPLEYSGRMVEWYQRSVGLDGEFDNDGIVYQNLAANPFLSLEVRDTALRFLVEEQDSEPDIRLSRLAGTVEKLYKFFPSAIPDEFKSQVFNAFFKEVSNMLDIIEREGTSEDSGVSAFMLSQIEDALYRLNAVEIDYRGTMAIEIIPHSAGTLQTVERLCVLPSLMPDLRFSLWHWLCDTYKQGILEPVQGEREAYPGDADMERILGEFERLCIQEDDDDAQMMLLSEAVEEVRAMCEDIMDHEGAWALPALSWLAALALHPQLPVEIIDRAADSLMDLSSKRKTSRSMSYEAFLLRTIPELLGVYRSQGEGAMYYRMSAEAGIYGVHVIRFASIAGRLRFAAGFRSLIHYWLGEVLLESSDEDFKRAALSALLDGPTVQGVAALGVAAANGRQPPAIKVQAEEALRDIIESKEAGPAVRRAAYWVYTETEPEHVIPFQRLTFVPEGSVPFSGLKELLASEGLSTIGISVVLADRLSIGAVNVWKSILAYYLSQPEHMFRANATGAVLDIKPYYCVRMAYRELLRIALYTDAEETRDAIRSVLGTYVAEGRGGIYELTHKMFEYACMEFFDFAVNADMTEQLEGVLSSFLGELSVFRGHAMSFLEKKMLETTDMNLCAVLWSLYVSVVSDIQKRGNFMLLADRRLRVGNVSKAGALAYALVSQAADPVEASLADISCARLLTALPESDDTRAISQAECVRDMFRLAPAGEQEALAARLQSNPFLDKTTLRCHIADELTFLDLTNSA